MNKRKKKQLVSFFNQKLEEWEKKKEQEHYLLKMKLANSASKRVSFGSNAFWERVVNQILIKAEEMNVSPRQIIKNLFNEKDSEAWILALWAMNE